MLTYFDASKPTLPPPPPDPCGVSPGVVNMASFHDERTPIAGGKKGVEMVTEDEGVVEGIYICFFP